MSKFKILGMAFILSMPASSLYAQGLMGVEGVGDTPLGAIMACESKAQGASCTYEDYSDNGQPKTVSGTCQPSEEDEVLEDNATTCTPE